MHRFLTERGIPHEYNDWNSRPRLEGVTHSFNAYYAAYGREILQFHAAAFGP